MGFPTALYQCLCEDIATQVPIFDPSWAEKESWMSTKQVAALSITRSLSKKFRVENSTSADAAALAKFLHVNNDCKDWSLQLTCPKDEILYNEFRRSLDSFLHPGGDIMVGHLSSLLPHGAVGPGSAIGSVGGDFYTKLFSSRLSCTRPLLYDLYRSYVRNFPEWATAEVIRKEHFGEANIVRGNRLRFVPKYEDISRVICVEPVLNMFYQLGLGAELTWNIKSRFAIDLSNQQFKNRDLARRGSQGEGFSTLDLESASDSISLRMLESVCPKWFYDLLVQLRSPVSDTGRGEIELNMVSTMGNGFTFPLQTALFACIVEAVAWVHDLHLVKPKGRRPGNFGVNGDDIVVPTALAEDVIRLLNILGFKVNTSKSFVEGPFRESCGGDYHLGRNVRGVYIKSLDTVNDSFVAINQLNLFSTRTGLLLPKTVQWLLCQVPRNFVPRWEDDSSGIKVPYSMYESRKFCSRTGSVLYRPFVPVDKRIRILDKYIKVPSGEQQRIYNPSGLLISFLQRSVRSCSITPRHGIVRYKRKLRVAPNWDAAPTVHPLSEWIDWQRWNDVVWMNLHG